jgi:hypothetical protein
MSVVASYLITIFLLLQVARPDLQHDKTVPQQPGDWIQIDTLDLHLTGPCFDVAFYQDDIIFQKPGEEANYLAAMDRPDPNDSRPLFTNKEFSCSPAAFSFTGDFSMGYYSKVIRKDENLYEEKIFEMSVKNDNVSDIRQIAFSKDPYRYLHPAVSSDGSLMVFSSDRPPTSGGLDLFVTRKTPTGWSEPSNLGAYINSNGHEWFPFLDSHNNLLFSSTGHSGYGGYDIYICSFNGKEWGLPRNLGKAINGVQNELGFSIHRGNKMALFSRTPQTGTSGLTIRVTLSEAAMDLAGIKEGAARDIAPVLQQLADPAVRQASRLQAEPAIQKDPVIQKDPAIQTEPEVSPGPDNVVFRVQIISSLYENSFPTVLIEGKIYKTYEYFYMGSFRITVGKFDSLKEANTFRLKCLNSGFKQAFVAAFRGDKRETDPSVFKQ